jgi:3-oxoacyl-[acyl-carrier protein] reductase
MTQIYESKFALVTGSSRGVGKLISEHFLNHGASVIGFSRGDASIQHPRYHHLKVDVSEPPAVQRGFDDLKAITETLHIVVNNAAVLMSQYAMVMPVAAAQSMLNTNLLGTFLVSREASKLMRKSKWGRIINIGSMATSLDPIGDSIYAASKAGMTAMTNILAKEVASLNVTCNTLAISAIKTDMLEQLPQDKIAQVIAGLPIPRTAEPEDILNVIDFFASERSSYITAQTIYLGGVH